MHLHSHMLSCPGGVLVVVTEKNMKILCGCKVVVYQCDCIITKNKKRDEPKWIENIQLKALVSWSAFTWNTASDSVKLCARN